MLFNTKKNIIQTVLIPFIVILKVEIKLIQHTSYKIWGMAQRLIKCGTENIHETYISDEQIHFYKNENCGYY